MKKCLVFVTAMVACGAYPLPALASEATTDSTTALLSWFFRTPPDWTKGILYAVLGLVGALVTLFGLIGGVVPGTAGSARLTHGFARLEERERVLDELFKTDPAKRGGIEAIEQATNDLRDDLRAEERWQFVLAFLLYVFLGTIFATLLARDLIQAIVIGAGWTGYLGAVGLKKDYGERKQLKDDVNAEMEEVIHDTLMRKLKEADTAPGRHVPSEEAAALGRLLEKARIARAI